MSKLPNCLTCHKPKANLHCALCNEAICKYCAQFVEEGGFSFLRKLPEELSHTTYCTNCFDSKVSGPLNEYNEKLEKAKDVNVFFKGEGKATRLIRRTETPYTVENCVDRDEALMKMSFWAVEDGFNTLVDIDLKSKKTIVNTYVTISWFGSAVPAGLSADDLKKTGYQAP